MLQTWKFGGTYQYFTSFKNLSYVWLIAFKSDLKIAQDTGLLST